MFELPGCLSVVECRRVAGELELLHHLLRAAVLALEEQRQINFEFDDLRRLVLIAAGRGGGAKERFKSLARFRVFLFLEWDLREVVLRFAELRIDLGRLLERRFRAVEIFLRQKNFTAQVDRGRLIRIGGIRFIHQPPGGGQVPLLKRLLGLFEFFVRDGLRFRRAVRGRGQLERHPRLTRRLLQPAHFVERFGEEFVQRRGKLFLRSCQQILRFLFVFMLQRHGGV